MDPTRISELLRPFHDSGAGTPDRAFRSGLSPLQLQSISTYIDILLRWNVWVNLTAIRQPEEIVTRHFGESLFVAQHLFPAASPGGSAEQTSPVNVIDLGSGAGFPGLPIKLWAPQIHLTLIESNQKKAIFLREVVRTLALANVDVFAGRADALAATGEDGDIVTIRAVERFEAIIPTAVDLVVPGGRMALLIGETQLELLKRLTPGFNWGRTTLLPQSTGRFLALGSKESS
jgi:16S rRNA (guanine527-N7)-methyltransferase